MGKGNGSLFAGLLKGYGQSVQIKKERENQEQTRKLQTKLFEKQLEQLDLQTGAQKDISKMMEPYMPTGEESLGSTEGRSLGERKSILDVLADPKGELLLMQSGVKPETVVNMKAYSQMMGGGQNVPEGFELQGVKYDTKGRPMYDYGKPKLDEPVSPSASAGYVDSEGRPAPPGLTLREMQAKGYLPKGPDISTADAGKITALDTATEYAAELSSAILDPNMSKTDRALLLTNMAAQTPKTKGRALYYKMGDAVDALFRARTGSAAPEGERKIILSQFMPSPFDSDDGINDKLDRFGKFVGGSLDIITLPENVRRKLEGNGKKAGGAVIDFSELPD
jgi:hypothetical protein